MPSTETRKDTAYQSLPSSSWHIRAANPKRGAIPMPCPPTCCRCRCRHRQARSLGNYHSEEWPPDFLPHAQARESRPKEDDSHPCSVNSGSLGNHMERQGWLLVSTRDCVPKDDSRRILRSKWLSRKPRGARKDSCVSQEMHPKGRLPSPSMFNFTVTVALSEAST